MNQRANPGTRSLALPVALWLAACAVPSHYVLGSGPDATASDASRTESSVDSAQDSRDAPASMDARVDVPADASSLPTGWPPTPADSALVCLMAQSCFPNQPNQQSLSTCAEGWIETLGEISQGGNVDFIDALIKEVFECTRSAFDCASISECLAQGVNTPRCNVDGGTFDTFCEGNKVVYCNDGGPLLAFDCTKWGLTCADTNGDGTSAVCTTGVACDGATFVARCEGDKYIDCATDVGREVPLPCGEIFPGTTCAMIGDEASAHARCIPVGPPCAQSAPRCEDSTTLVECDDVSGREFRTNCQTQFGSNCLTSSATAACGIPAGRACDDTASPPDRCGGVGVVDVCVNGAFEPLNCSAIGKSNCVTAALDVLCQ